jgi:hypothetical protein
VLGCLQGEGQRKNLNNGNAFYVEGNMLSFMCCVKTRKMREQFFSRIWVFVNDEVEKLFYKDSGVKGYWRILV